MRRVAAALVLAAVAVVLGASGAGAADAIIIRKVDSSQFPTITISALVQGPAPGLDQFALRENGRIIAPTAFEVIPLGQTDTPVGIVLVVDTSGSMRAQNRMEQAKAAARQFVAQKSANDQVAIVAFADQPRVVSGFTNDVNHLTAAVEGLVATGETALFDGVRLGATLLSERPDLQANMVVLSDGADTVSQSNADAAEASILTAKAVVFAVGLPGREFDSASLTRFANASGGQYVETTDPLQLSSLYGNIQSALQNQYEISYTSSATGSVEISLAAAGARTTAGPINAGAVAEGTATAPQVVQPSRFSGLLGSAFGITLVVVLVFVAAALVVLGVVALAKRDRSGLDETLRGYGPNTGGPEGGAELDLAQTAFVRRAVDATARLAKERGLLDIAESKLEQADLPIRPAEALFFYGVGVVIVGVVGLFLAGLFGAFVAVFLAALVPVAVLNALATRRKKAFTSQLPDMLQLLASTLRAGYSLLQGAEATTDQVGDPMAKELRRVLSEARLGRPLEQAFADSARRVGSADYDWAVMAIRIQREVGGNLAELLQTVSETMVARERLRREINTLTAEGKISAIVLGILPLAIGLAVYVLNPGYLDPLFHRTAGKLMVVGALVVGVAGFAWMKKIITIET
jgi:tight adherence protein B